MPDDLLLDAGAKINETGVVGAVCIMLILALGWLWKTWRQDMAAARAELQAERELHQKTRELWLADVKSYATIGETVREQLRTQVPLLTGAMEMLKELERRER